MKFLSINLEKAKKETIFLALILVVAAYFRLRGLSGLDFFTYDQARDALYMKRILEGKLRLIGTQSSIPGLYTGPFYYYLMAPFLALFKLNPVGLDYGTALFSLATILLFFIVLKKTTGSVFWTAAFTSLYAFSPQVVAQSRFAWNPNPLPLLTMIFLFSLWMIIFAKKDWWLWPLAISVGAAINFHYSSLAFFLILYLIWFIFRPRIKDKKAITVAFFILGFFFLPLLLFDLRHGFINSQNIFKYFLHGAPGEISPPPFLAGLWQKARDLFGLVFPLPRLWRLLLTIFLLVVSSGHFLKEMRGKKTFFSVTYLSFIGGVIFASFYRGSFFTFYLTFLYPLPFLLAAHVFKKAFGKSKLSYFVAFLVIIAFLGRNLRAIPAPSETGRLDQLVDVSHFLVSHIETEERFNLAVLYKSPDRYDRNGVDYRYLMETKFGLRAPGWDVLDYQKANSLYLISEKGQVDPFVLNFWEMDLFGPKEVSQTWELGGDVVIYKLVKRDKS